MPVYIDIPNDRVLRDTIANIAGWCADSERSGSAALHFRINGQDLSYLPVDRSDVLAHYPQHRVWGFTLLLDLSRYLQFAKDDRFDVEVLLDERRVERLSFRLAPEALAKAHEALGVFESKRRWCIDHLQCPLCRRASLVSAASDLYCSHCESCFIQNAAALNLLTPELAGASNVRPTSNVSSNHYDSVALDLIEQARRNSGKVLDCGAGLRAYNDDAVINMEIVDYPTTDIIAVGEAIPFRDNSFDAVLSLAVLEHVSDPFACAKEIARVLKPGGTVYCVVPFLQPEHGFPNHFYNMTRQGIANLFKGALELQQHFVPASGLPIWSLHWFLREYSAYLTPEAKARFSSMSVADFLSKLPTDWLADDIVTELSTEGNWILACTTALLMSKPESSFTTAL